MEFVRYKIRVNNGNENVTIQYYFYHKDYETMTREEQDAKFDEAVKELNRIYKTYGRFATQTGVTRLFESFGFVRTMP